uniref:Uncharacterized protein n=1 Tax=Steinernema glaseri TaxID=37863 RepID=A0A1I7ZFB6_9BILA
MRPRAPGKKCLSRYQRFASAIVSVATQDIVLSRRDVCSDECLVEAGRQDGPCALIQSANRWPKLAAGRGGLDCDFKHDRVYEPMTRRKVDNKYSFNALVEFSKEQEWRRRTARLSRAHHVVCLLDLKCQVPLNMELQGSHFLNHTLFPGTEMRDEEVSHFCLIALWPELTLTTELQIPLCHQYPYDHRYLRKKASTKGRI